MRMWELDRMPDSAEIATSIAEQQYNFAYPPRVCGINFPEKNVSAFVQSRGACLNTQDHGLGISLVFGSA